MNKWMVSGFLCLVSAGCAVNASDSSPAPVVEDQAYAFAHDSSGELTSVEATSVGEFTPMQKFGEEPSDEQTSADEAEPQAVVSCSGSCNASVCVCYGTYACCAAGCAACFAAATQ